MAKQPTQTRVRRREKKNIATGVAHVNSTFNNTMITISDVQGNTIAWSSAGTMGFKGSRKSTPFAAQMAAEDAGKKAAEHGVKSVDVEVRGLDLGENLHLEHYKLLDLPLIRLEMLHRSHITVVDQENVVAYSAIYFNFLNDGATFI